MDAPGVIDIDCKVWLVRHALNAREFMRVSLNSQRPSRENIKGSRCPDFYPWHSELWVLRRWISPEESFLQRVGGEGEGHPLNCIEPELLWYINLILRSQPP
jgi:hypothetical protein